MGTDILMGTGILMGMGILMVITITARWRRGISAKPSHSQQG